MDTINFQLLFNTSPCQSAVVDSNFVFVACSDLYAAVVHKTREELIGNNIFDVFSGNDTEGVVAFRKSLNLVIASKQKSIMENIRYDIEVQGCFEERWWKTENTPILENGKVIFINIRVDDITELLALREYKTASLKELARLTASLKRDAIISQEETNGRAEVEVEQLLEVCRSWKLTPEEIAELES